MASKKPAPKKAAAKKPAPKKAAPAKKPAPKKAAPAKKPAKPAPKPAPKKAAPAKKAVKPVAKPAPKKVTPAKKAAKPVAKPAPKKAVPARKPVPAKKVVPAKPVKAAAVKPVAKPVPAAPRPAPVPVKPAAKLPPAPPVKPVKKQPEPIKEVKVPKLGTKSSVPYQPGYTQLEKRMDIARSNGEPLVKYSDADLNEFRELITKKLEAAKKELAYLQGLITRKDELGGDNDDARYMTMEDGSMSMEREQLSQMASRQITYIDHLEKAMMRIENKTYGICRVTGKLIDKARLRAVPHATLSLEAKLGLVKPSVE
jgi:RNA polymerase-binding transcription factor DksA